MSLYNMLFGVNQSAPLLLAMLGTDANQVPRFRDCYLDPENNRIVIHTRTGGGNRDYYDSEDCCRLNNPEYFDDNPPSGPWNSDLRALPGFLYDRDDDFDCTYADFYYRIPESFEELVDSLRSSSERSPAQAWQELFAKMESGDANNPQVAEALEKMRPVMEKITSAIERGD